MLLWCRYLGQVPCR